MSGVVQTSDLDGRLYIGGNQPGFRHVSSVGIGSLIKSNLSAVIGPSATDDSASGYLIGSTWINVVLGVVYTLVDDTPGAAVWSTTGGATTPGGIPTEVQFNSAGSFDGIVGSSYDGSVIILPSLIVRSSLAVGATVILNGQSLVYPGTDYNMDLAVQTTYTDGSKTNVGTWLEILIDPTADSPGFPGVSKGQYAILCSAATKATNTKNFNSVYGQWAEGVHQGSGIVNNLYGAYSVAVCNAGSLANTAYGNKVETFGGNNAYGSYAVVLRNASYGIPGAGTSWGHVSIINNTEIITTGNDNTYGFAAIVERTGATGGSLSVYGYYSQLKVDVAGAGTLNSYDYYANARSGGIPGDNDYYLWFGTLGVTTGVYRIKTDGIMGYYNPSFATPYVPGSTNYERVVQQWVGNVLQYGTEASGTGVLRGVQIIGESLVTPKIKPSGSYQTLVADNDSGGTITFDMSVSNFHHVVLDGNHTLALTNVSIGQAFTLYLEQDGVGFRIPTWFTTIRWIGGSAPVLTTTINKIDAIGFHCISAGVYIGFVIGKNA